MLRGKRLNFGNKGLLIVFHTENNKRDSTRTSSAFLGNVPLLSKFAETRSIATMNFDVSKLRRVVIENTGPGKKWSRRSLSLAATNGKNPDLVRDFISRGQDRKPSFEAVTGLANAMGMDVNEFLASPSQRNAPVYIKVVGCQIVWRFG